MPRYAVISGRNRTVKEIEAYLPGNYEVTKVAPNPGGIDVLIEGEDNAGWSLDGYVLPRLASGNIYGREYSDRHDALDALFSVMI